jgi:hypothetical protein
MNEVLDHEIGSPAVTRARKKIGLSWRTVHVFAKLISASLRFMTTGNSASPRCTTYRHAYAEFRRSEPVIDAGPQSASDVFDEGQTRISSARHLRHGSGVLLTHSKTSIGQWCTGRFAGHAPRKIASADRVEWPRDLMLDDFVHKRILAWQWLRTGHHPAGPSAPAKGL